MRKIAFSIGLAGAVLLTAQTFANTDDDKLLIVHDVRIRLADEADTNNDGKISRKEYLAAPAHDFNTLDENNDGFLDRKERRNSGFSMRSEYHWDEEAHAKLMERLDEKLAGIDEKIAEAMERLEESRLNWHGEFDSDGFDFRFTDFHDDEGHFFGFGWLGKELMKSLDEDDNGQISREEFVDQRHKLFDRLDENEDGILDEDELATLGLNGAFAFEKFHSEDED